MLLHLKAFKRRTSISSEFSDTASVASFSSEFSLGASLSTCSAANTPRRKRPRALYKPLCSDAEQGLPPRPPARPNRRVVVDNGVIGSVRKVKSGVPSINYARSAYRSESDEKVSDDVTEGDKNMSNNNELTLDLQSGGVPIILTMTETTLWAELGCLAVPVVRG